MIWIAHPEKNALTESLEKRLWDTADQFRANSGSIPSIIRRLPNSIEPNTEHKYHPAFGSGPAAAGFVDSAGLVYRKPALAA